jgi:predicted kinase
MRKIIVVIGRVGCGKDFFADHVFPEAHKIDVGTLVRQIIREQRRVHQANLDTTLNKAINEQILSTTKDCIITGVRQASIYTQLQHLNALKYQLIIYHLTCPLNVLKERWTKRNDPKDLGFTFEDVLQKDGELGLDELEALIDTQSTTIQINTNINENDVIQKINEWKSSTMVH